MTILLSNDDGVDAKGLALSYAALSEFDTCHVVAPSTDCSGRGHSLTLGRPLRRKVHANGFHSFDGTPADCVHLAISGLFEYQPQRIVSGINRGANLGDDVLYSGTVAAAMEGRLLAKNAVAISSCGKTDHHLAVAAQVLKQLMPTINQLTLPKGVVLNVNVPALELDEIQGLQITRLGHRMPSNPPMKTTDPRGEDMWWIGRLGKPLMAEAGTDFHAIAHGYVSITPLHYDKTDYQVLSQLQNWATHSTLGFNEAMLAP